MENNKVSFSDCLRTVLVWMILIFTLISVCAFIVKTAYEISSIKFGLPITNVICVVAFTFVIALIISWQVWIVKNGDNKGS